MDDKKRQFDFWYAVNNTEVLRSPSTLLETFGNTLVNYHLLTEPMDSHNKVRIRVGRVEAYKPQILTPSMLGQAFLEGFGDSAGQYVRWLSANEADLMILKYGFAIRKQEVNDYIVSESMPNVASQIMQQLDETGDPMSALLLGVDDPWEVCLLKLMVETIQRSSQKHVNDLRRDPDGSHHDVELRFLAAARDPSLIQDLGRQLQERGLFEQYEDRFFSLVRQSRE